MSNNDPCCQVRRLYHSYQDHQAVADASFTIGRQSIHGFVGPNGAGKTTTLKILATLIRPQRGVVEIFGQNVSSHYKNIRSRIGYMQDHFSMYRQMTVNEYLDFFGAAYGLPGRRRIQTITDILDLTDMTARRDHLIGGLSRGMQQRVSLARALVHDPDLLLLDEPASGLDPRARIELMDILRELRQLGKTIFISSHILTELATLCDHVTILDHGVVKYSGTMQGLIHDAASDTAAVIVELEALEDSFEQALARLDGMVTVKPIPEDSLYRLQFDRTKLSENAILQTLLDAKASIKTLRQDTRMLSEAFMDLTQPGVSA